jgi:hypothetical protein
MVLIYIKISGEAADLEVSPDSYKKYAVIEKGRNVLYLILKRTESVLITSVIDAYKQRVVGVYDIPRAFFHAKQMDLTYIKMTGEAADLLITKNTQ